MRVTLIHRILILSLLSIPSQAMMKISTSQSEASSAATETNPSQARAEIETYPLPLAPLLYSIVSPGNCSVTSNGSLFNCQFPDIQIQETTHRFPFLPFETKMKLSVSMTCRGHIDSTSTSLRVEMRGRSELDEEDLLLQEWTLLANQNQIQYYEHPLKHPYQSISVRARNLELFQRAVFPQGCRIELQIQPNRISIRSIPEAERYLSQIWKQNEMLSNLMQTLTALRQLWNESKLSAQLLEGSLRMLKQSQTQEEQLHQQIQSLGRLVEAYHREITEHSTSELPARSQHFARSILKLTQILNSQNLVLPEFDPIDIHSYLTDQQIRTSEQLMRQLEHFLDPLYLQSVATQLAEQRTRIEMTRHSLEQVFQENIYPLLCEDLCDLGFTEICGGQGLTDCLQMNIRGIAPHHLESINGALAGEQEHHP